MQVKPPTVPSDSLPPSPASSSLPPTTQAARERAVLGRLSDMDLRLLQVFKSVVDCGGMAAAELVRTSAPARSAGT